MSKSWLLPFCVMLSLPGAWMVAGSPNIIRAVLWLGVYVIGTSFFYLIAGAEFLAVVQILVYASALVIMYLVAVMMVDAEHFGFYIDLSQARFISYATAVAFTIAVMMVLAPNGLFYPYPENLSLEVAQWGSHMEVIGKTLFSRYLLPFEVAGLVLLVAIVGIVGLLKEA